MDSMDSSATLVPPIVLPRRSVRPPVVGPDCPAVEIARIMGTTHSPLTAVVGAGDGTEQRLLGAVTFPRVLEYLVG